MKKITRYFLEGLLFVAPIAATIFVVYKLFITVDRIFPFDIPGLGVAVTLAVITTLGFIMSNYISQRIASAIDRLFTRLPLMKIIYTAVKDLAVAFMGDKKTFNKPVMVTFSTQGGVGVLGFVTSEDLTNLGIKDRVAVYLPQAYNFSGNLMIVPREQITPLAADSADVMKFIVTGGMSHAKT